MYQLPKCLYLYFSEALEFLFEDAFPLWVSLRKWKITLVNGFENAIGQLLRNDQLASIAAWKASIILYIISETY